jgi:epoxide hydrolase-like predicted phosphatase
LVVRAVLFDYGGTLTEVKRPWKEVKPVAVFSAFKTMKRNGLRLPFEQYRELNDSIFQKNSALELEVNRDVPDPVTYQEIVDSLFPSRTKAWRRKVAAQAADAFWGVAKRNFVLRKSTRPTLKKLKAMKLRLAVISNHHYPKALTEHLAELRIASYFSKVYASAKAGLRKPDPRFFEMCLASIKVHPREAIYIGDSLEYDVEGANRAGMYTILVSGRLSSSRKDETGVSPDFVVHDLLEVPQIVTFLSLTAIQSSP